MVSGFLLIDREFRYSRVIQLWLQVLFYSVGGLIAFSLLIPGSIPKVGSVSFLLYFVPAISGRYWYFSAYFVVALFIPFINKALTNLDKKQFQILILTIVFLFSFWQTVWGQEAFHTNKGISEIWLICMYCCGGYVKRFGAPKKLRRRSYLLIYFAACLLTWSIRTYLAPFVHSAGQKASAIADYYNGVLFNYCSPTTVLEAFALLCCFSGLDIRSEGLKKAAVSMGKYSFGVYLFHMHPLFKSRNIIKSIFRKLYTPFSLSAKQDAFKLIAILLAVAVLIFAAGIVIDFIRSKIFSLLGIEKTVDKYCDKIIAGHKKDLP